MGPTGLLYDREWALLDDSGRALTQKSCSLLATVQPYVDLCSCTLRLTSPRLATQLIIPFEPTWAAGEAG